MVTLPSAETSNSVVSQPNDVVNIAWVERKDVMGMYPALAVAIQNLQALPYEINGTSCCLSWRRLLYLYVYEIHHDVVCLYCSCVQHVLAVAGAWQGVHHAGPLPRWRVSASQVRQSHRREWLRPEVGTYMHTYINNNLSIILYRCDVNLSLSYCLVQTELRISPGTSCRCELGPCPYRSIRFF